MSPEGEPVMSHKPAAGTVIGSVRAAARRYAENPAVIDGSRVLSYAALWHQSGTVAQWLREHGAGAGEVVALAARRSADLVTGLLGILRAGAILLPLDISYPPLMLRTMLDDGGARIVTGHSDTLTQFAADGYTVCVLDDVLGARMDGPAGTPTAEPAPEDACYLLYTSGSTGTPKGVLMPHAAVSNFIRWQAGASACAAGSRTLQFAAISFDVVVQEVFATLITGGTLVCITEETRRNPHSIWELIVCQRVERVFLPHVALQSLAAAAGQGDLDAVVLREIISVGEQLQCTSGLRDLLSRLPGCRLINQYGPTETHVTTCHNLAASPAEWPPLPPVGAALPGNRVLVLDQDGREVPAGEAGEIYIAGTQVSYGYWKRPRLTAQCFLPDPCAEGKRMYRSGDLGRKHADGTIEVLGRIDNQFKLRGFRIEPGEVEHALTEHPAIRQSVVAVRSNHLGDQRLVAWVICERGEIDRRELRAHLRQRLPEHMTPSVFVQLQDLPVNPNGKVDRRALPDPEWKNKRIYA